MLQFCFCHQMSYQKYFSFHRFFWNSDSSKWFLICNIICADGGIRYLICIWRDNRRTRGVRNLHRRGSWKGISEEGHSKPKKQCVPRSVVYGEKQEFPNICNIYMRERQGPDHKEPWIPSYGIWIGSCRDHWVQVSILSRRGCNHICPFGMIILMTDSRSRGRGWASLRNSSGGS